jgi:hypothetical protein
MMPSGGGPFDNNNPPHPGTGIHANVVKRVKFGLKSPHNSSGWTILRNNPFVINGPEQMIEDQTAQRKTFNPKRA